MSCGARHPRLIEVRFRGSVEEIWEGIARHGRPIQYAYLSEPLAIWDTWTRIAGQPVAFEPPSAGFILDWTPDPIAPFARCAVCHPDPRRRDFIDRRPGTRSTSAVRRAVLHPAINAGRADRCRTASRRVIAIGTTVVRALEHAHALTGRSNRDTESPPNGSVRTRAFAWWMPSCPECTNQAPAITIAARLSGRRNASAGWTEAEAGATGARIRRLRVPRAPDSEIGARSPGCAA